MKTLEGQTMPTTIETMQGAELPPFLQKKFKVKPQQFLKITIEVITTEKKNDDSEFDIENLGDSVLESLQEIVEAKRKGIRLPNARDLLNEL